MIGCERHVQLDDCQAGVGRLGGGAGVQVQSTLNSNSIGSSRLNQPSRKWSLKMLSYIENSLHFP